MISIIIPVLTKQKQSGLYYNTLQQTQQQEILLTLQLLMEEVQMILKPLFLNLLALTTLRMRYQK